MRSSTRPDDDTTIETERLERSLLPADPPAAADIAVEEARLPYDLSGPRLSQSLVRVIEHYGLPERPLVTAREEDDSDGEYQVLSGGFWVRAAREAGLDRIPVRALEVSDTSAAFLALVLNQARAADVAAQADALQALLEKGFDEQDLARMSGLGKGRVRRLVGLLELHPVLRQGLREGRLQPQVAFATSGLSEASQAELAARFEDEGELTSGHVRQAGDHGPGAADERQISVDDDPEVGEALAALVQIGRERAGEDPAARARRQAEELLRTLEEASITGDIRERVAEVVDQLRGLAHDDDAVTTAAG